jgi:tricorn protease
MTTSKIRQIGTSLLLLPALFGASLHYGSEQAVRSDREQPLPSFSEPAISPDRAEIAFVSGGDIWTVPAAGGEARLLVSHPANDARPLYAPDGRRLAFISNRTGGGDIYLLTLATGELKRLTFDDGSEHLDAWARDGKWIYYSSTSRDIGGMNDIYRVSADGGTPMQVSADRYVNEFFAAPSPDGQSIAFSARGNASAQWWRKGHSHLDESEVWVLRLGAQPVYEKVSAGNAKELSPLWSGDGRSIFYVSDRSGAQNIWVRPLSGQAKQVTQFKDGRVLWPDISPDGRAIVFERNFGIWKLDTGNGQSGEVKIALKGASAQPVVEHATLNSQFQDLALSPDGKKIAFSVRGEIFAASAKDGGAAARVTRTAARESQVDWTTDSKRIVYLSERDGTAHLFLYDFAAGAETQLTGAAFGDGAPRFSPDGKQLAYVRDGKELHVMDVDSKQDRVVAKGYMGRGQRSIAWSPDSRWLAYVGLNTQAFRNVFAVPAAGGDSRIVSAVPNGSTNNLSWSPDGTYIIFNTNQRTEEAQVVRVDLILRTPKFREDQFRDLFKEEPPRSSGQAPQAGAAREARQPEPKPVEIVFDGIRQRASFLQVGVSVDSQTISPDGKWLLLTASAAGQQNLYTYSLDEMAPGPAVARQLTSTPGAKSAAQFSPDSREVYYLEGGRISSIQVESRQAKSLNVTAELDVDFSQEKMEVFRQAWTYLRDGFYDAKFHGADWNAVRAEYAPRIAGAQTPDEMRRLLNLMVGELNSSHMGVSGPGGGSGGGPATGKLGLRFDRTEYENAGRLKVTEVINLGPAAVAKEIRIGDYLAAVDGEKIAARSNLDELLANKVGHRVALSVSAAPDGSGAREVAVLPVNQGAEKNLLYRQWVEANRAYVEKASGGRLGYVHMNDMSENSLTKLYTDLDADNRAKDGVVIDIRNNNGGFVNVYAIDVLARRGYLTMTPRDLPSAPARSVLGQRALELPTILVTNQHSLSDAEDFTEGYRTLKLGKVVGEPTAGWIIFTGSQSLVDGSSIRMPGTKITSNDGADMELNPRPVDVPVTRPIGESLTGKDSQLDTAVAELLKQLRK